MRNTPIYLKDEIIEDILEDKTSQLCFPIQKTFYPAPVRIRHWTKNTWAPESNSGKMFLDMSWNPFACPYSIGDKFWVKEHWAKRGETDSAIYKLDEKKAIGAYGCVKWKTPFTMPRWASRINIEITDIKIDKINDEFNWIISFKKL